MLSSHELSALVKFQFETEQENEYGYLCMGEIYRLDIEAEYVKL